MSVELYNDGDHKCIIFRDLVRGQEAVQANQVLVYDHDHAALIDPGGELTYSGLFMGVGKYLNVKNLDYVVASHQDPDIVASLSKWLVGTNCKVVVPELWARFVPHFTRPGTMTERGISIPDKGMHLDLGSIKLMALPAHFLHAEGNFNFYDPKSKILFSGDMGANLCKDQSLLDVPVQSLNEITSCMEGFHRRYMNSNKVCRFWVNMIRQLDVQMIAPQHGRALVGNAIEEFLTWIENLECGVDLFTQDHYKLP